jgi:hypothetical protein
LFIHFNTSILTVASATVWLLTAATTAAVNVDVTSKKLMSSAKDVEKEVGRQLQGYIGEDIESKAEKGTITAAMNLVEDPPTEETPNAATTGSRDGEGNNWNPFRRLLGGFVKSRELRNRPPPPAYAPPGFAWTWSQPFDNDDELYAVNREKLRMKIRPRRVRKLLLD